MAARMVALGPVDPENSQWSVILLQASLYDAFAKHVNIPDENDDPQVLIRNLVLKRQGSHDPSWMPMFYTFATPSTILDRDECPWTTFQIRDHVLAKFRVEPYKPRRT